MADNARVVQLLQELLDFGGTPEEVCRSCPELLPQVRARWQRLRALRAEVGALFPPHPQPPPALVGAGQGGGNDATPPSLLPADLPRIPGHEVLEVLGRGGMGVVYKAWNRRLQRPVAVKMLLAGAYAQPEELERFLREAETVAGLRHANIVQVHEAGEVDGRPYFTMEFIEGGSLAHKLSGAPLPARPAGGLVAVMAEAVHEAHRRGVVHRDLKPGNILLSADGTPKLSDFGLARRLEGAAGLTQTGTPVGTPSYMAPEQAEGKPRDVGPAADIYALGAILYELLTGRPPFRAETAAETMRQVVSHDPVPPSRLNAAVPRDPETICLKCLEKDPRRRYPSALALAQDLHRFERNEPILARPMGPAERTLRWIRRHPTAAALVATALALFGLASGGGVWLVQHQAQRRTELHNEVGTAVSQAESLRKQFHFREARHLLEQARQQAEPAGLDDLRQQVKQARDHLELAADLDMARMCAVTPARSARAESLYEETLARAGIVRQGDNSAEIAARVRDSAMSADIIGGLDDWASITEDPARREWLLAVVGGADPNSSRNRVRQLSVSEDVSGLTKLVKELGVDDLSPQLLVAVGRKLPKRHGEAVQLLSLAQARYPQDFWINYELGWTFRLSRRYDEALGFFRAALALRPDSSPAHKSIGIVFFALNRPDEAISHYREAMRLDPKESAGVHIALGQALLENGQVDEAISTLQEAMRLDPRLSAEAHVYLGEACRAEHKLDEAISHYQESIRLDTEASAMAHHNLGLALWAKGREDDAISHYRETVRLDPEESVPHIHLGRALYVKGREDEAMSHFQEAMRLDPKSSALAHTNLGVAQREKGQLDKAIGTLQEAIRLDPNGSARAHNNLGLALWAKGRHDEAIGHYQDALRLDPKMSAEVYSNLGAALYAKGRVDEAIRTFQEAIRLDPKGSAAAHANLGAALGDRGRLDDAISLFQESIRLDPRPTEPRRFLYTGQYAAACAAVRAAGGGPQETSPGEQERARLRRRALDLLRADLELRTGLLEAVKPADLKALRGWSLTGWQTDPALAGVRDETALAKLPDAEREQWQRLWADVAALLAADPRSQVLAHLARREWGKAAECYKRALERDATDDGHFWFEYAAVLLLSGDRKGYENACAHMVERCGKAAGLRPYHVARACTLAADAVPDASLPGRLAERELRSAGQFWSLTEQGALHYRAGRFNEAVALFEQSLQADSRPGRAVLNWLWLALAQQRLGKTEEARRWLDKATAWLDQYREGVPARAEKDLGLDPHNWLEANVLRQEAEALLQSSHADK
jgi:serine/threonine-protein kinase